MICLRCDNEEFKTEPDVEIEQEYKGETIFVRTTASICTMCGWVTVTPEQADELRHKTECAYIERHAPRESPKKAICPHCKRLRQIVGGGVFITHRALGGDWKSDCPGSRQPAMRKET